jgi:hypothetical protein
VLFVKSDGADTCEEAPDDVQVGDPAVVRREQWIVAGDQYVFVWKDEKGNWRGPELGEYEARGHWLSWKIIDGLEELISLVRRRLEAGEPRENMHHVLLALL